MVVIVVSRLWLIDDVICSLVGDNDSCRVSLLSFPENNGISFSMFCIIAKTCDHRNKSLKL